VVPRSIPMIDSDMVNLVWWYGEQCNMQLKVVSKVGGWMEQKMEEKNCLGESSRTQTDGDGEWTEKLREKGE
jgi:hypothetical protein